MQTITKFLVLAGVVGLQVGGMMLATGPQGYLQSQTPPAPAEAAADPLRDSVDAATRQELDDRVAAARMGMSPAEYRRARDRHAYAQVGCHLELQRRGVRAASSTDSDEDGWRARGEAIILSGRLATAERGGGARGYDCVFDMRSGQVTKLEFR